MTERLYPGDDVVDWLAVDGYSRLQADGHWPTPDEVFDGMLARLDNMSVGKPLGIAEVGMSTGAGSTVADKGAWITDFFGRYVQQKNVRMVLWWNSRKPNIPEDWRVFGGSDGDATYTRANKTYNVYTAYRAAIAPPWLIEDRPMDVNRFLGR
jgi:hypothetical protein